MEDSAPEPWGPIGSPCDGWTAGLVVLGGSIVTFHRQIIFVGRRHATQKFDTKQAGRRDFLKFYCRERGLGGGNVEK